jgi:hypothetical protein
MATTPEGWVKKAVKELLECWSVYYHMPVQNGMGKPSLDFICCVRGQFLSVETKAPGNSLTPRQALTAAEIGRAGGRVLRVADWGELQVLWNWPASGHAAVVGNGLKGIPADLRVKWERYFRNAGCKDVDQHPA